MLQAPGLIGQTTLSIWVLCEDDVYLSCCVICCLHIVVQTWQDENLKEGKESHSLELPICIHIYMSSVKIEAHQLLWVQVCHDSTGQSLCFAGKHCSESYSVVSQSAVWKPYVSHLHRGHLTNAMHFQMFLLKYMSNLEEWHTRNFWDAVVILCFQTYPLLIFMLDCASPTRPEPGPQRSWIRTPSVQLSAAHRPLHQ